ncbi:MAG: GNAT family N-acetyltransferase, partial [Peptococcaceae bacterium]|nr:GNAT family N-acetyltransferase [Peptococcaceae bacterium]
EKYICNCAALVLPETFDDYKKRLSKSTRQNIRTAINRQKRDGKLLTHEMIYSIDEQTAKTLMRIRAERLPLKKKHAYDGCSFAGKVYNHIRDVFVKFFSAEQNVIHDSCNPWCFLVKDGEQIAGFYWGISNNDRTVYYVILAGVEEAYEWYSPCVSHFYKYIEELYETENRTIKVFDFTRGGEQYKKDLGAEVHVSYRIDFKIKYK